MSLVNYYLFRHMNTKQVVGSLTPELTHRTFKQITDITTRPSRIRLDLWRPLVVSTNNTPEFRQRTHLMFIQPIERTLSEELLRMQRKARKVLLMDSLEHKVEHLCRIYMYLEAKYGKESMPQIKLFWDQEGLKDSVVAKGIQWPSFVSHDKLSLDRGRFILNPECQPADLAQASNEYNPTTPASGSGISI
ncbi:hypothetical protein IWQ62_003056 [Dispira parvispora]|uniref:Uncharacterized protein n=1 Tax=Dispira parvispora TaxID=1520584 RepID=A0A9W8ARL0_9FUNG|nr:hypothetical protein IWQ62_003056 [Dispira parvispora]